MEKSLQAIWENIWSNFPDKKELIDKFWLEILKAYSAKSRHYHNLNHISQMLDYVGQYSAKLIDQEALKLAIFYHDIIYSARRTDNEEQSALLAEKSLVQLNYLPEKIEKIKTYILATKSHLNYHGNPDLDYLLDFDLGKLGASWQEYTEYTNQIRKEYHIFPDIIYKPGRKKVLKQLLSMEKIYKTPEFYEKFELNARQNLAMELSQIN
jgi:predicted metal-dependent HD superfamily phosphohydrolase